MERMDLVAWMAVALVGLSACGDGGRIPSDAGRGGEDAGLPDVGLNDAGRIDGGTDAGGAEDGGLDAGADDGGTEDAGVDMAFDMGGRCRDVDCSSLDDVCVVGVCDPATGMCRAETAPDGTTCNDEVLCTETDVCTDGVCEGTEIDCSAEDAACAVGVCAPELGTCVAMTMPDDTVCDDGFVCTTSSACTAGVCAGEGLACTTVDTDLTMTSTTTTVGGSGGGPASGTCPAGEVLIGFRGEIETGNMLPDRPGLTRGVCGSMAIDAAGAITTTETGTIGPFGAGDDPPPRTTWERLCPADEVVVGFAARTTTWVLELTFRCAPLTLGDAAAGYPVLVGTPADLTAVGDGTGALLGPHDCGAGEAAVGVEGRAGAWIDRWSLECAPLAGDL
ncbi:MAG: hypothetical protein AAGH15_02240 [Myxococcota bacterium]